MNKIYPLFSSSKGNSTYIGNESEGVLVDAGVSCKRLCEGLSNYSISPSAIKGILITHTHSDHIKGLKVFAKKFHIPIFAQNINLQILAEKSQLPENCKAYKIDGAEFKLGSFCIKYFETPHDTPASCGYKITDDSGKSAVVCTDLGEVTSSVWENLCGCSAVLIESNYDKDMLIGGNYPYDLKMRIASNHGHLSNNDCAKTIKNLISGGTKKFILGHLSQENNLPDVAEKTIISEICEYQRGTDFFLQTALPQGNLKGVEF